jgi:hypothetical protein
MHETLNREEGIKVSSDRSFGIVFFVVFVLAGTWMILRDRPAGWLILASSLILLVISLVRPSILGSFNRAWFKFGILLSRVFNPLILGVVFFLVITPMAVTRRLMGKDSLNLKFKSSLKSYWVNRNPPGPKPDSMTRQF